MPKTVSTLNSNLSTVELCQQNGWVPGTRLVGDEGYGPEIIELTAVGRTTILAIRVMCNGKPVDNGHEGTWTLRHRDWKRVSGGSDPAVCADF